MKAYYEEWEYSCCGKRFRVGDEVTWRLALMDVEKAGDLAAWRDHLTELDPELLPALRRTAVARAAVSPPKGARLYGMPRVSRHDGAEGGETQPVTARVRAIHAVSRELRADPAGSGSFAPVPGRLWLSPVDDSKATVLDRQPPGAGRRVVTGWLITLATGPT
jgi:uncharacterized protein DUF6578